jgi:hypothetical protein
VTTKKKQKRIDTRSMPDDTRLPGHMYTLGEMRATIAKMKQINAAFYSMVFENGMASRCHTFVEFCGLQAKFIDFCEQAMIQGIDFTQANQHSGEPWPLDSHHARYLGEKFQCIWGFAIGPNPELRRAFIAAGLGGVEDEPHSGT